MKQTKRILITIPALGGGGAERVVSTLANGWVGKNYEVCLVTYDNPSVEPYYNLDPKILLVQLDSLCPCIFSKPFFLMKRFFGLRKKIRNFNPDVVVSFLDTNNIMTIISTLGFRLPVIISERVNPLMTPIGFLKRMIRNWAYKKASSIIVQNKGIKMCFPESIRILTKIIPNPILIPKKIEWHGERKEFVSVGRFDSQKGFDDLIEAFSKIANKKTEWTLKIIGDGIEREKLEKKIKDSNLSNRVFLPGTSKEVLKEIAKSKIFVLSSLYEGMPNALMEAMSIGMPVISTDCDFGPSDLINDKINGLLVPPKNPTKLADAMLLMAEDPALQKRFSQEAYKKMKQYELTKILSMWDNEFDRIFSLDD
jgi:glycosyltransferase involved in cell wall biosynthesis